MLAPVAPSAIQANSIVFTLEGPKSSAMPVELDHDGIRQVIADFARSTANARFAGFDGVEIHAANGYLIDQFIRDGSNHRTDIYGGSALSRTRFARELVEAAVGAWDPGNIGIRLSPFGTYGDMHDSDPETTFSTLIEELNPFNLAYLHMVEEFPFSNIQMDTSNPIDKAQLGVFDRLHAMWKGAYIANGGFNSQKSVNYLNRSRSTAISFGRPFIANPDLVERMKNDWPLATADNSVLYGGGAKGYTDFPKCQV